MNTDRQRIDAVERYRLSISYSVVDELDDGTTVEAWTITDDFFRGPWVGATFRDAVDVVLGELGPAETPR